MAIAYDSVSEGYRDNSAGINTSWSHTCSGSDRILIVHVGTYSASNSNFVTGVTYNGVAMTPLNSFGFATTVGSYMFYLVNPASGTNTITVQHASQAYVWGLATSYTGVDQTTPIDSSNGTYDSSTKTSWTASTTVVGANCWLVSAINAPNNISGVGAGTTLRQRTTSSLTWTQITDSNGTVSTGSQSQIHTGVSGTARWHIASLAEAAASGVTVTPAAQALTFSVPTYSVTTDTTVAGTTPEVTLNTVVPTVNLGVTHTATEQVLTLSIPTYDVLAGGNVSSTVNTQELTLSIPTYDVSISNDVAVAEQGLVLSPIQPTIQVTADALQLVNTLTLTLEAQSVKVGGVWGRVGRNSTGSWTRSARNSN